MALIMSDERTPDYYEVLQVSTSAEPETIHRVYRHLAQRLHPDNHDTGNRDGFQALQDAYTVLSDPQKRAQYDVHYEAIRRQRWRLVSSGVDSENDFGLEQRFRLTVLEALYTKRRVEPENPSLYPGDLETMIGRPREHLEFTIWFLLQKKFVQRDDMSRLVITAEGVEHLEENYQANLLRRLPGAVKVPA
jgi:curved DNA-binding protein CbpA